MGENGVVAASSSLPEYPDSPDWLAWLPRRLELLYSTGERSCGVWIWDERERDCGVRGCSIEAEAETEAEAVEP
jgi:hypothetical protein